MRSVEFARVRWRTPLHKISMVLLIILLVLGTTQGGPHGQIRSRGRDFSFLRAERALPQQSPGQLFLVPGEIDSDPAIVLTDGINGKNKAKSSSVSSTFFRLGQNNRQSFGVPPPSTPQFPLQKFSPEGSQSSQQATVSDSVNNLNIGVFLPTIDGRATNQQTPAVGNEQLFVVNEDFQDIISLNNLPPSSNIAGVSQNGVSLPATSRTSLTSNQNFGVPLPGSLAGRTNDQITSSVGNEQLFVVNENFEDIITLNNLPASSGRSGLSPAGVLLPTTGSTSRTSNQNFGVPLQGSLSGRTNDQVTPSVGNEQLFVINENFEDIIRLNNLRASSGRSGVSPAGVPLPTTGGTSKTFNQNFGVPLPGSLAGRTNVEATPTVGNDQLFVVNGNFEDIITLNNLPASSGRSGVSPAGVPLPTGDTSRTSNQNFGVPLPGSLAGRTNDQITPSVGNEQLFVVNENFEDIIRFDNLPTSSGRSGVSPAGVPLPTTGGTSTTSNQNFGVPLPGSLAGRTNDQVTPSVGNEQLFVVNENFEDIITLNNLPKSSGRSGVSPAGVPLPTTGGTSTTSNQNFGVPLPSSVPGRSGDQATRTGGNEQFFVVDVDLEDIIALNNVPASSGRSHVSPTIGHTSRTSNQNFGVPLPGSLAGRTNVEATPTVGNDQLFVVNENFEDIITLNNLPASSGRSGVSPAGVPFPTRGGTNTISNKNFGIPIPNSVASRFPLSPGNDQLFVVDDDFEDTIILNDQPATQGSQRGVPLPKGTSRFDTPQNRFNFVISDDDENDDISLESHFGGLPNRAGRTDSGFSDDVFSAESFDDSTEVISLGRRFHPSGIPRKMETTVPVSPIITTPQDKSNILNPFIFTPEIVNTFDSEEDSQEIDDDDIVVRVSNVADLVNPERHDERLSLTDTLLNQYNFVDVQGSTKWGYKTNDQYQDHTVHKDGTMDGKFGWSSPEGHEIKIEYIADNRGYRVVSSQGLFRNDAADVSLAKEKHFQEHAVARSRLEEERLRKSGQAKVTPSIQGKTHVELTKPTHKASGIGVPFPSLPTKAVKSEEPLLSQVSVGVSLPTPEISPNIQGKTHVALIKSIEESSVKSEDPISNQGSLGASLSTSQIVADNANERTGRIGADIHVVNDIIEDSGRSSPLDTIVIDTDISPNNEHRFDISLPESPGKIPVSEPVNFGVNLPSLLKPESRSDSHSSVILPPQVITPQIEDTFNIINDGTPEETPVSQQTNIGIALPSTPNQAEKFIPEEKIVLVEPPINTPTDFGVSLPGSTNVRVDAASIQDGVPLPILRSIPNQNFLPNAPETLTVIEEETFVDQTPSSGPTNLGIPFPETQSGIILPKSPKISTQKVVPETPNFVEEKIIVDEAPLNVKNEDGVSLPSPPDLRIDAIATQSEIPVPELPSIFTDKVSLEQPGLTNVGVALPGSSNHRFDSAPKAQNDVPLPPEPSISSQKPKVEAPIIPKEKVVLNQETVAGRTNIGIPLPTSPGHKTETAGVESGVLLPKMPSVSIQTAPKITETVNLVKDKVIQGPPSKPGNIGVSLPTSFSPSARPPNPNLFTITDELAPQSEIFSRPEIIPLNDRAPRIQTQGSGQRFGVPLPTNQPSNDPAKALQQDPLFSVLLRDTQSLANNGIPLPNFGSNSQNPIENELLFIREKKSPVNQRQRQ